MVFTWEQFHNKCPSYLFINKFENYIFRLPHLPGTNELPQPGMVKIVNAILLHYVELGFQSCVWWTMINSVRPGIAVNLVIIGSVNTLRPRQNGRHFPDDIFKCIFLNENVWISIKIPLKFVPKVPINNIPALFQIMAWRRPGDKPLSETMMVTILMHIKSWHQLDPCGTNPFELESNYKTLYWRWCI